jgi:hypothetical protein
MLFDFTGSPAQHHALQTYCCSSAAVALLDAADIYVWCVIDGLAVTLQHASHSKAGRYTGEETPSLQIWTAVSRPMQPAHWKT